MDDRKKIDKEDYEALAAFRSALRRFLAFSEQAAHAEGLTPQQHQALLAIKGQPGKDWASIKEIAEALQMRHNAAVGLIQRCETAGLVQRCLHEPDRRVVRISLTEQGEAILAHLSWRHLKELSALRQTLHLPFTEA